MNARRVMSFRRSHARWAWGIMIVAAGCSSDSAPPANKPIKPPLPDLSATQPQVVERVQAAVADVSRDPQSADTWGRLGLVHLAQGFKDDAAVCFTQARRWAPTDFRWPHLASFSHPSGDLPGAIEHLRQAIKLKPNYVPSHLRLAEFLIRQGQPQAAADQYARALSINPRNVHALLGLGRLSMQRGELDAAIKHLESARVITPDYKEVCAALSRAYLRKGRTREADILSRRARSLPARLVASSDPLVHLYQSQAVDSSSLVRRGADLVRSGKCDIGLNLLRQAAKLDPQNAANQRALGSGLTHCNMLDEAITVLRLAVTLAPDRPRVLIDLGIALSAAGQTDEALQHFQRIIALDPLDAAAWYNMASCQAGRRQLDDATQSLQRYIELNPGDPKGHLNLGNVLLALDQPEEALAQFRTGIEYEPHLTDTYLAFTRTATALGRFDECLTLLDEGLTRLPNNIQLKAARAWVEQEASEADQP